MKVKLAFFPLLVFCTVTFYSFKPLSDSGIKVTITNLRSNKGHVLISLFKEGIGYPGNPEKAFRKAKVAVSNNNASLIFEGVPTGTYAIAILHDENDDAKMNTNMFGVPKEGYGFSNNVMGAFGPPSYSKASFRFNGGAVMPVEIKARY